MLNKIRAADVRETQKRSHTLRIMGFTILQTPFGIFLLCPLVLFMGCSASTQITNTPRSSIEQRLLVRSLERAMGALDIEALRGKTVTVDLYGLTPDKDFAREFCTARLQGEQVRVITDPDRADLRLKIIASVLALTRDNRFWVSQRLPFRF